MKYTVLVIDIFNIIHLAIVMFLMHKNDKNLTILFFSQKSVPKQKHGLFTLPSVNNSDICCKINNNDWTVIITFKE